MVAQMFLLWSCTALGAACVRACAHTRGCAAVQGSYVHPQLSGKEATAFRRKMNISGGFTASQVMGQKISYRRVQSVKTKTFSPLLKQRMCLRSGILLGRNWPCWRVAFTMHKRLFWGLWWENLPFQNLPWKNEGRVLPDQVWICFQTEHGLWHWCVAVPHQLVGPWGGCRVWGGAWTGSGVWSGEWWSSSICQQQPAARQDPLLRLSFPAPMAHRCPSCSLTCLTPQERSYLRGWPHTCVEKSLPRPSALIPNFLKLMWRLLGLA